MPMKPITANEIQIKMFLPAPSGSRRMTVEQEVNEWLSNQGDDIVVHDIFYQHCTTPKPAPKDPVNISEDKVSVVIVYSWQGLDQF